MSSEANVDVSVPPCSQTHGSEGAGWQRWHRFRDHHLAQYAQRRNDIRQPHAVSRMSCYLNFGVVSIFRVVHDLWVAKARIPTNGPQKFEDEIIKWREIGYVHSFGRPHYNLPPSVPRWAREWLANQHDSDSSTSYPLSSLEMGTTGDEKWNAMQRYLVETGELHNNARMTWGKTMLHWQRLEYGEAEVLQQMIYVNDRYALDGLSPPSYAGLLWCLGWCDKPGRNGSIATKPASRYRVDKSGFVQAQQRLTSGSIAVSFAQTGARQTNDRKSSGEHARASPAKRQKSIDSFFKVTG